MIIWNLLIGPCLWHSSISSSGGRSWRFLLLVPVCSCGLDVWLNSPGSSSPMDRAQRMWNAGGGCRRLILAPLLPYTSHQPNWDCRSNLVKNGCCYCVTGCAFGFTVCWEHTWAGAADTMGRGFWMGGGVYFWHLKDDSPQASSSASYSFLPRSSSGSSPPPSTA